MGPSTFWDRISPWLRHPLSSDHRVPLLRPARLGDPVRTGATVTVRQILKFTITCDGYYPDGRPCSCDITVEADSQAAAEAEAKSYGWYEDHRGWLCNAGDGHRGDRAILKDQDESAPH
jgi:hypothetical protein